jgi:aspartyl-tRNA(Asn)/glutamyl-tRNA(Gln) amidotransferase subunit A
MKNYTSLHQIQIDLHSGKTSCLELVKYYLSKIEQNKHLNAFLEVYGDEALQIAEKVDQKFQEGKAGKLAGMVIGIKDNICYKNHKCSAGSKILEGFTSLYSATVVERLIAEDAIIIGRLNCDEFGMGSSNENSAYGPVLNPLDESRVPGGSSGGSVAAVCADLCLAALGTDTGGSIRQPSSFCGTVGLKPSYGRVSRWGAIAYASSFDQIGPIAKSVEDTALMMEVMAGKDGFDSTASSKPVPMYSRELKLNKKVKLAYLKDCLESKGLDSGIQNQMYSFIEKLRADGHTVEGVSFDLLNYLIPTYYVLTTAEASSNLSRYDGVHFGYRSPDSFDLESTYKKSRTEGFGKEVKRRIMLGTFVLSAGYYDAYYAKAQKVRNLIRKKTNEILSQYDFILTPTTPTTAFKLGEKTSDPITMYLEDIFTVQAPLAGLPAISLPLGKHANGLPFGFQFMGSMLEEASLLAFSQYLMKKQ